MFKYNELSDLLNGELVTPIQKDGDKIICLDKNLNKVYYTFDDFDFDKTEDERIFIVDDGSSDDSSDSSGDNSIDNSTDSSDDIIIPKENNDREHWITDNGEKSQILSSAGYSPNSSINNVNIIQFSISN